MNLLRHEPALVAAVVVALSNALAVPEPWQKVLTALLALLAGVAVRSQVTPVAKL